MKFILQSIIQLLARIYLKRHKIILVAVAGSVGKTSTKEAIATVLKQKYKVRVREGNHNTHFSVPPSIAGVPYPDNVHSPLNWLKVMLMMYSKIIRSEEVEVVVQELGTDRPGDMKAFSRYLKPDITVVTAVSAEHMEAFKTLDAVAKEELSVAAFSKFTVINRDDISEDYAKYAKTSSLTTYGTSGVAEYRFMIENATTHDGFTGIFVSPEYGEQTVQLKVYGEHNIRAVIAAGAVGVKLQLNPKQIIDGMQAVRPVSGRMNIIRGVNDSILIDDTYNSSPLAVKAALQTLYNFQSPQRIAILGSMNELGETSAREHQIVGEMCDPKLLAWVVTVGEEAEKYLAPAAKKNGCQVRSFKSPYDAGTFVHSVLEYQGVVLAKGSQNGVFAEEAVKILLHSTEDYTKLVRQSQAWLDIKKKQFLS